MSGRRIGARGVFWLGIAEKLTPSTLIIVIATLGYQVYRRDLDDAVARSTKVAAELVKGVADSVGGALGTFNANQQEMFLQLRQITAEHQSDRARIARIEGKMDRASNIP